MTVGELKRLVMFQYNLDSEDAEEFAVYIITYLNEAYDRMVRAWTGERHAGGTDYPLLASDDDTPKIPERFHRFLADWATWLLYRNGNSQKQQRGYEYRNSFETALTEMKADGGAGGDLSGDADGDGLDDETGEAVPAQQYRQFYNIPR